MRCSAVRFVAIVICVCQLVACGGGGGSSSVPAGTGSGNPPAAPPPASPPSITALDNSAPTAMSVIHVKTQGLSSAPITVTFTDGGSYSFALSPLDIASDGTLAIAVPLYLDPATGKTSSVNLAMTLSQGQATSAPVTLAIQDIPHLSDFGTPLGAITRAFYNYQIMSLGDQIGALRAVAASSKNTVALSNQINTLNAYMLHLIKARHDVDRIVLDNSVVITLGNLPDGTNVNIDRNALEMKDRILGLYIATMGQAFVPGGLSTLRSRRAVLSAVRWQSPVRTAMSIRKRPILPPYRRIARPTASRGTSDLSTYLNVTNALTFMGFIKNLHDIDEGTKLVFNSNATTIEQVRGFVKVTAAFGALVAKVSEIPELTAAALIVGAVSSGMDLGHEVLQTETSVANVLEDIRQGDTAKAKTDAQLLVGQGAQTVLTALDSVNGVLNVPNPETGLGGETLTVFGENVAGDELANSGIFVASKYVELKAEEGNAAQAESEATSVPLAFAEADGNVNIANSNPPPLAALTGVQLDQGSSFVSSDIADPSGNYQLFVPIGDPSISYSNLQLTAYDPSSDNGLASTTVDVSGLVEAGAPYALPTLSGSCSDTDAGTPDADDPDCGD